MSVPSLLFCNDMLSTRLHHAAAAWSERKLPASSYVVYPYEVELFVSQYMNLPGLKSGVSVTPLAA